MVVNSKDMTNFERVGEFLRKFDLPHYESGETPFLVSEEQFLFRYELIIEEVHELLSAYRKGDVVEVADAIADLLVVTYGLAHYCCIPIDLVFKLVMDANMKKERAKDASESKRGSTLDLVKPPGWQPPDLSEILR